MRAFAPSYTPPCGSFKALSERRRSEREVVGGMKQNVLASHSADSTTQGTAAEAVEVVAAASSTGHRADWMSSSSSPLSHPPPSSAARSPYLPNSSFPLSPSRLSLSSSSSFLPSPFPSSLSSLSPPLILLLFSVSSPPSAPRLDP